MTEIQFFPMDGGENQVDPVITTKAGELHNSLNYENRKNGGYRRIDGFERFDGRASPAEVDNSLYASKALWIAAVEAARTNIQAVTGSGKIRGIWSYKNDRYAFRNNTAGTANIMYKATTSGWAVVPMSYELTFTTGTSAISDGDVITGSTSAATGTVGKIILETGDWSTNDAAGRIYLNPTPTGTFQAETITNTGSGSASITGAQTVMTFNAGGDFRFVNYNFYGSSDRMEMFGVNGEGYGFGFDGTCVWFIHTGMTTDKPEYVHAHKKHLFFSFEGGSIQHSSIGNPNVFNAITGASEIAIGQECVGFSSLAGGILAIFGRNNINLLYGSSAGGDNAWNLSSYSLDTGAIENSIQSMDVPYFLDDRGVKRLYTSMDYGDFDMSTISQKVNPTLSSLRGTLVCSLRVRTKDQYRLFFSDGTVLVFAFDNRKLKGVTKCNYGYYDGDDILYDKVFTSAVSVEDSSGEELLFVGDDDGFVYQLDKGPSFDGKQVTARIRPIFYHFKSPERIKRFIKIVLEIETTDEIDLSFVPEFTYGDQYYPNAASKDFTVSAGAGIWDVSTWEQFYWDTQALSSAYGYLRGIGTSFRMAIQSQGTYDSPHTIQAAIIHFSRKGYRK